MDLDPFFHRHIKEVLAVGPAGRCTLLVAEDAAQVHAGASRPRLWRAAAYDRLVQAFSSSQELQVAPAPPDLLAKLPGRLGVAAPCQHLALFEQAGQVRVRLGSVPRILVEGCRRRELFGACLPLSPWPLLGGCVDCLFQAWPPVADAAACLPPRAWPGAGAKVAEDLAVVCHSGRAVFDSAAPHPHASRGRDEVDLLFSTSIPAATRVEELLVGVHPRVLGD